MATNPIDHNESADPSLSRKAWRIGPNVSPEHRAILEAALDQPTEHPLFATLASMPNVGKDSDFERNRG
jgi:plasmid stability protein